MKNVLQFVPYVQYCLHFEQQLVQLVSNIDFLMMCLYDRSIHRQSNVIVILTLFEIQSKIYF